MSDLVFDNSYARLPEAFFERTQPDSVPEPDLIAVNADLAGELGIDLEWLRGEAGLGMLSGNALPTSADPIAMVYAGHQFGGFSPQLGDGRALLLGELVGRDGIRRDVQLKGSGQTPFSRRGDGKSPLGPVIREYVLCEAMAALGIPTTRALAAVATGEMVQREGPLPGGVFARVATSHVRVGTFQFFASRGDTDSLRQLADYVIERHYPEVVSEPDSASGTSNRYRRLLEAMIQRQAVLIARWMQVGFIHGVMNTDNMQIAGETIDFGPCAFMEAFDPATVFSSIDSQGRYAWGNQPGIGQWNLTRLAEALIPLFERGEGESEEEAGLAEAKAALATFAPAFHQVFMSGFARKLGLPTESETEESFVHATFATMQEQRVDFTLFYRHLTQVARGESDEAFLALFSDREAGEEWLTGWRSESGCHPGKALPDENLRAMAQANPIFIPRNHRVEQAIQAALAGDYSVFEKLNEVLARPFEEQAENADYEKPASPEEAVQNTFCGT